MNNAQAALNGIERELNSNNTALEKADKGFNEAGDEAKDFSNSVKKTDETGKDAYGKLSKLVDTTKKIGAALRAAVAALLCLCRRLRPSALSVFQTTKKHCLSSA